MGAIIVFSIGTLPPLLTEHSHVSVRVLESAAFQDFEPTTLRILPLNGNGERVKS